MRKFFLPLFLISFLISCQNEINLKGTIQGVVVDKQDVPIEGATVSIFYLDEAGSHDISKSTETTADGKFSFPEMNYCTFRLEVTKTGYLKLIEAFGLSEKETDYRVVLTK